MIGYLAVFFLVMKLGGTIEKNHPVCRIVTTTFKNQLPTKCSQPRYIVDIFLEAENWKQEAHQKGPTDHDDKSTDCIWQRAQGITSFGILYETTRKL